jgi:hypothetical protein
MSTVLIVFQSQPLAEFAVDIDQTVVRAASNPEQVYSPSTAKRETWASRLE